ncbi:hypothetical protein JCM9534A_48640 [Catenuloplanes indicus JCM 9534]
MGIGSGENVPSGLPGPPDSTGPAGPLGPVGAQIGSSGTGVQVAGADGEPVDGGGAGVAAPPVVGGGVGPVPGRTGVGWPAGAGTPGSGLTTPAPAAVPGGSCGVLPGGAVPQVATALGGALPAGASPNRPTPDGPSGEDRPPRRQPTWMADGRPHTTMAANTILGDTFTPESPQNGS